MDSQIIMNSQRVMDSQCVMDSQLIFELADWSALRIQRHCAALDVVGTSVVREFIRRLLVEYWQNGKTRLNEDFMQNICFDICDSLKDEEFNEDLAIDICEIFAELFPNMIRGNNNGNYDD